MCVREREREKKNGYGEGEVKDELEGELAEFFEEEITENDEARP